jgi:hypothetical protein
MYIPSWLGPFPNMNDSLIKENRTPWINHFFVQRRVFFCFVFCSFIHMCIHCLGHFSTLFPSPMSPLPSSVSGRSLSALVTDFVEEMT